MEINMVLVEILSMLESNKAVFSWPLPLPLSSLLLYLSIKVQCAIGSINSNRPPNLERLYGSKLKAPGKDTA